MKSFSRTIWGLIIVAIGVIFFGNTLDLWNVRIFFDGWWTLFIIVPCLVGLCSGDSFGGSILGLCIAILMLLACQEVIEWNMVGKIFIPIVLVYVGLSIILRPNKRKREHKVHDGNDYLAVFSSSEDKVTTKLEDLDLVAVFGGITLDLRDAIIKNDVTIECVAVFGGIDIMVPDNVNVKYSGVPIFGGIENKAKGKINEKNPTIYVEYVCVFGGTDIK